MNQFDGALADDMDAEEFARLAMKEELQYPTDVADNLTARDFAIHRFANFIRHALVG